MTISRFPAIETELDRTLAQSPILYCEIGARRGGKRFRAIGQYVRYYGFEPDEPEAARLKRDLEGVFGDVRVLPHAVMHEAGRVRINVLRHRGCSSVLEPDPVVVGQYATRRADTNNWPRFFEVVGTYECDARRLDDVAKEHGIERLDFLGLDTQGTERDILDGGRDLLSRTTFVHVEMETVPIYRGQPLVAEMVCWLSSAGFRLISAENLQYISRSPAETDDLVDQGELISLDGLFYRDADLDDLDNAPAVLRRMLLLDALTFRTLAIDVGRRALARRGDWLVQGLTEAMTTLYTNDNAAVQPLRAKVRRMLRRLRVGG